MGVEVKVLRLPQPIIIIVSILLGFLCLNLLVLGLLSSVRATWTARLDSWAIIILGSELSTRREEGGIVGVLHESDEYGKGIHEPSLRQELRVAASECSGVVGDLLDKETLGLLAVGAEGALKSGRQYKPSGLRERGRTGNEAIGAPPLEPPTEEPVVREEV